jgi:MerR-like DNA binding protein
MWQNSSVSHCAICGCLLADLFKADGVTQWRRVGAQHVEGQKVDRGEGTAPCTHVLRLIERHRDEVQSRIRELQELQRDLSILAAHGAHVDPSEIDPAAVCRVIPSKAAAVRRSSPTAMLIASASNQAG